MPGSVGAGRESAVRRRAPHPCDRVAQDLETPRNRKTEIEERRAKALEEERAELGIVAKQRDASVTVGELECRDLVACGIRVRRQSKLHDDCLSVARRRLDDIRLGCAIERFPDGDVPPLFEVPYDRGKLVEPRRRARGGGVSSEDVRNDQRTRERSI
jgi:hypothetical protein